METNQKVYIKWDESRGKEVINELLKLGASNALGHYGMAKGAYYYINKKCEIDSCYDEELLKDAGYKEIGLPEYSVTPFASVDDVERMCRVHGHNVKNKCAIALFNIYSIIRLIRKHHSEVEVFKHLMDYYEFEDGTPCGNVVNEN